MKTSQDGLDLVKQFEGLRLTAYKCAAGIWTIGYGTTIARGVKVKEHDTCTKEQAEEYLRYDLRNFEKCINDYVIVSLNQNQFDALVSLAYNIGCGNFTNSTLLKELNLGNYDKAAQNFKKWNKITVRDQLVENTGLTKRRLKEATLFQKEE